MLNLESTNTTKRPISVAANSNSSEPRQGLYTLIAYSKETVFFDSKEDIVRYFNLDSEPSQDDLTAIARAAAAGEPLWADIDPFEFSLYDNKCLILAQCAEEIETMMQESEARAWKPE